MASNIFEKVLENVDIQTVVSEYVTLEPKGKNLFGLCPFHDDHNASMSVSKEKGIYYCFVCHSGGNAIKFIENYKHISSLEAAKYLANEYHIDVSEFKTVLIDKNKNYYELMGTASKLFKFLMNDEGYSKDARNYLKGRGINEEIINDFGIGLSPNDFESLSKTLTSKGFSPYDIELNGLSNGERDTFVNRIIVPIHDEQGRTVAFGGRIYMEKDLSQAKYLNSKETPIFKKGELLFNLDKAVKYINQDNPYLIINEGYMDVISASSVGIKNSIALMGTSLTKEQAELIKKYTKNVCICLDSDEAGIKGVRSVINRLDEYGINYSITLLKGAKDPDEFIRKFGKDKYLEQIINYRLDKFGYIYELTKLDYKEINTFNMDSFKKDIFVSLKDVTSKATLEIYLRRLSQDLKVSYDSIKQDFDSFMSKINPSYKIESTETKVARPVFEVSKVVLKAEKLLICYALKDYEYYEIIEKKFESRVFMNDLSCRSLFIEIGDLYDEDETINTADLILKLKERGVYNEFLYDSNIEFSLADLKNNVLKTFDKESLKEKRAIILSKLSSLDPKSNEAIELSKEYIEINKELRK